MSNKPHSYVYKMNGLHYKNIVVHKVWSLFCIVVIPNYHKVEPWHAPLQGESVSFHDPCEPKFREAAIADVPRTRVAGKREALDS
jgi:hypothetical protein